MIIDILLVLIFLAILVLVHEFGHFAVAKLSGVVVQEFGIGFPPAIVKKKIGETIYSLNWIWAGGFVRLLGEESEWPEKRESMAVDADAGRRFNTASWGKRFSIIIGGVLMNFILGWLIISFIFTQGIPSAVLISGVAPESPAAASGILPGDRLVEAKANSDIFLAENGASRFTEFIYDHRGEEVALSLERNGEMVIVSVVPRVEIPPGQGALGIALVDAGMAAKPWGVALRDGLVASFSITREFFSFIGEAIMGQADLSQVSGPVGVFKIGIAASEEGWQSLLQLFALISLNLAVFNILPIPALDGGRLLFLVIERIKGSPLSQRFTQRATLASFIILILLLVAVTVKDIGV